MWFLQGESCCDSVIPLERLFLHSWSFVSTHPAQNYIEQIGIWTWTPPWTCLKANESKQNLVVGHIPRALLHVAAGILIVVGQSPCLLNQKLWRSILMFHRQIHHMSGMLWINGLDAKLIQKTCSMATSQICWRKKQTCLDDFPIEILTTKGSNHHVLSMWAKKSQRIRVVSENTLTQSPIVYLPFPYQTIISWGQNPSFSAPNGAIQKYPMSHLLIL